MPIRAFTVLSLLCVFAGAHADSPPVNQLSRAERAAGWKLLFDGRTTGSWRAFRKSSFPTEGWMVEDGCLRSIAGHEGDDIITTDQYTDFELSVEWKPEPKANSGIMYRVAELHDATWQTGPEYQLLDDAGNQIQPTDPQSAGALYDLYPPSADKIMKPAGEFNQSRIRLQNNHVQHWLNGVKVVECDIQGDDWTKRIAQSKFKDYDGFGVLPKGYIALQHHGSQVSFRNIKIRDLSGAGAGGAAMPNQVSLFDGKTLRGWTFFLNDNGKMQDVWSVKDGIIICKGEPAGYIRTETDYKNYVLKLEWRFNPVTKQAGNSGVLLRMVGEDKVWPKSVEAQLLSENAGDFYSIEEFPIKGDSKRTNGRNIKKTHMAERPVGQWNDYEIIVDGNTITLFVNGDLVNQGSDVQEVPGKICLQSEGSEIQFRNIRLAPIN